MANSLYTKARVAFLSGLIDVLGDTINVALATASYSPNVATDEFFDAVEAFTVGTPQTVANISIDETGGDAIVFGDPVTFVSLTGDTVVYIVIYKYTGDSATSRLIALLDTASGLPLIPNGTSVPIAWSVAGIFSWLGC